MKIEKQFRELLKKYKNGSITKEELNSFVKIYSEHKELESMLQSDIREEWTATDQTAGGAKIRSLRPWRIAAVAASFLLLLSIAWFLFAPTESGSMQYATTYGERKEIVLPDGSTVLMNANTQLEWDSDWESKKVRRVKIEGEAFFDVQHLNENTQFIVETDQLNVRVTGTTFNVRDRNGDVDVFLNSGKVNLELNEGAEKNIPMDPGQEAEFDRESGDLVINEARTLSKSASWVEGMFEFENEYLPEILASFEDLYGVNFDIRNEELLEKRMDLSLPYSADWDLLRQALEIALKVELIENQQQIIVQ